MIYNSSVIRPKDILRGSGMLEIASYGASDWYNVGAISDLSVTENFNTYSAETDTVYEKEYLINQNIKVSFVQHESLNSDAYEILRGVDTITEELDGTTEQIKIASGDLSGLNEIKARITTKIGNDTFYFYFHRGFVQSGKTFNYKADDANDDNRVKQPWTIVFYPDSANSDQIYYTLQPSYYNEKFHKCQGDILTGVTLYIGPSNNMPLSDWTLYDSETYDDSTYAPTAYYQSRMMYKETGHTINYTGTGDANDVRLSYRVGNNINTLTDWTTPSDAVGSSSLNVGYKYLQYRFIFYSDAWTDSDSITVTSIT